jgi:ribulose-5-phosphate 4-epimerase/fuculose-1-phosphate aldolase
MSAPSMTFGRQEPVVELDAGRVELSPRQQFALMLRILVREGFVPGGVDRLSGHAVLKLGSNHYLTNQAGLAWAATRASDVLLVDADGAPHDGRGRSDRGATLHWVLHQRRDVTLSLHHHPQWSTMWANLRRIPAIYDQTGAKYLGNLVVVDEYDGAVESASIASGVVAAIGDSNAALLAGHGVLVLGDSVADGLFRALALEERSRRAWLVSSMDPGAKELGAAVCDGFARVLANANYVVNTFQALAHAEIVLDQAVLD